MQQADFEAELKSKGFTEIESKTLDPRPTTNGHTHDYDIRGLVAVWRLHREPGRSARDLSRRRHLLCAGRAEPHRRDRG